jgi:anaerobic selenocysteine-containing dehydrogenase
VTLSPHASNRVEESRFYLTTRRGKQFNSMLWSTADPTTGSTRRDAIFISHEDAHRLGLREGDSVLLRATASNPAVREMRGTCKIAAVKSGTLQAFWPEANVLISSRLDPASHEPDYNAWVTLEKL